MKAEIIEHLFANLPTGTHDADEINLKTNAPTWSDATAKPAGFDRAGPIGLVQDIHSTSKDNRAFLHARFGLGEDVLTPYKATKVIANHEKALGQPEGLAKGPRP